MGTFFNADIPEIAQQSKGEINGLNLFACTGIITEIVTRFSYSMLSTVKKDGKLQMQIIVLLALVYLN